MNLDGVEPLVHITESTNVFREDVPHTSLSRDEALSNAPKRNEGFFKVPKVLG
jgi:aspartyl-tRNA(Asn)/glutamyl-tRNA(Gln) amidotransferase subunit C